MALQLLPLNGIDRLPVELMEQILDNTKDDIQTLHACCFVCVRWHSYVIDSLYRPIRLRRKHQIYQLARASCIYPAVRDRLALASSVILDQSGSYEPGFVDVFPLVLGPHLHKVQNLTLRGCFELPVHPSFFVKLPQLKDVKHLHLYVSPPEHFADFQRIVCAFSQLEELDIAGLQWSTSRNASQLTPPRVLNPPQLSCVRVSDDLPEFFCALVAWLSSDGICRTIRRLDIFLKFLDGIEEGASINALLVHTASTLEHLRMHIPAQSTDSLLHAHSRCHIACHRNEWCLGLPSVLAPPRARHHTWRLGGGHVEKRRPAEIS